MSCIASVDGIILWKCLLNSEMCLDHVSLLSVVKTNNLEYVVYFM